MARLREVFQSLSRAAGRIPDELRKTKKWLESGARLEGEAQRYWTGSTDERWKSHSHWRGSGIFRDQDDRWSAIGRQHFELFETFARAVGGRTFLDRIVEWGCGGGANALYFGPRCREYVGVDVSARSLEECGRQLAPGAARFVPVQVTVAEPEAALGQVPAPCDLFLCTYVFELIPSADYGRRILRIAHRLLAPVAMAMIQIKHGRRWRSRWLRRGYREQLTNLTAYRIEQFWTMAQEEGFSPRLVHLVPDEPLVRDGRYAYFCLLR